MPIDYSLYPSNWKTEIRPRILERAANKCEQCGAVNHTWIMRHLDHPERFIVWDSANDHAIKDGEEVCWNEVDGEYRTEKPVRVILTVAHLDQNINNNDPSNLRAFCQRCHLNHDRADNLRRRKAKKGQLPLPIEVQP